MARLLSAFLLITALSSAQTTADLSKQISDLTALVTKLQARVDDLESKLGKPTPATEVATVKPEPSVPIDAPPALLPGNLSVNLLFDGYYGWNFNNPIGRDNLLRAYDVSSNAFS